ncbi:MAG: 2-oxo acid dehydrogenase subunit E2 [Syntrophales bacterium]|jgi:pyruvate dehydrogenase E2 component (dihydrolipoamide acetyltransferase)|nr:2-oxo acid dehydrogenase subunit E2 [Syntrophales bacterium]MCU0582441.1 2-oxo acid dehydrogenase subunit E2 [Syntrophales bacterium]
MPVEIVMPKLGLTMTEGLIVEWRKKEGDPVKKGDILFVLETEKVTYEVEAPEDGTLGKILVKEQETVPVGAAVAYLLKPGEAAVEVTAAPAAAPKAEAASPAPAAPAAAAAPAGAPPAGGRVKATPLAKKVAKELGVDLAAVAGSGPGGRILREDVEKAKAAGVQAPAAPAAAAAPAPAAPAQATAAPAAAAAEGRLAAFTGMRKTIAKRMLQSKVEAAQAYMGNTVDATRIQALRAELLPFIEKKSGVRITITDLMMKVTGAALREHPVINTRWTDKGVLFLPEVNMGMAMALDEGLIVPVIKNINAKSLGQVAQDRVALIEKGKKNSFLPDDIKGSTFTLSAMGMFGLETFTAIINQPENAILAVGAILDKPVALKGEVVIRPMMTVNLTYDHRTIDGAEAGKFMRTLKEMIEEPLTIL